MLHTLRKIRVCNPHGPDEDTIDFARCDELVAFLRCDSSIKECFGILDDRSIGTDYVMWRGALFACRSYVLEGRMRQVRQMSLTVDLDIHYWSKADKGDIGKIQLVRFTDEICICIESVLEWHPMKHGEALERSSSRLSLLGWIVHTRHHCTHP